MSTIASNTAYSQSYYSSGTNVRRTGSNAQGSLENRSYNNSDQLTISPEGEMASNQLAASKDANAGNGPIDLEAEMRRQARINPKAILDPNYDHFGELAKLSKHKDIYAWAMGVSEGNDIQNKGFGAYDMREVRNQALLESAKLDGMISDKLKTLGITLDKKETLNFSVNNKGEIKVSNEGIPDAKKREAIEKALNDGGDIAIQMKFSHAMNALYEDENNSTASRIIFDTLLRREMGISLDDLEWIPSTNANEFGQMICNGDKNDTLQKIFDEERLLYDAALNVCVGDWAASERGEAPLEYKFDFSYRNGIVIEKGRSDITGLNKRINSDLTLSNIHTEDLTLTLDGNGEYVDSKVSRVGCGGYFSSNPIDTQRHNNTLMKWLGADPTEEGACTPFTAGKLQQFAADAKRLTQYEFGIDPEQTDDFSIEIVRHVNARQELRITASKSGTINSQSPENSGAEESQSSEGGAIPEKENVLTLFSISSNNPAFSVEVRNEKASDQTANPDGKESTDAEVANPKLIATLFARQEENSHFDISSYMQTMIQQAMKMYQEKFPPLQLQGSGKA